MKPTEFYVGGVLVTLQNIFAFWGFSPASTFFRVIGVLSAIGIVVGFWMKKSFAWRVAIIIAMLGILGDVLSWRNEPEWDVLTARIILDGAVVYWLLRPGVKAHFQPVLAPQMKKGRTSR